MSFDGMMNAFSEGKYRPDSYERYYEQESRLDSLGISLPPKARVLELQAPFAKLSVDVLTEVLIPAGFIIADEGQDEALELISKTWQANDMDSQFTLAAAESIAAGACYWVVTPPDEEHAYATVHPWSARNARVRVDFQGRPVEGIVLYRLPDGEKGASYYTPEGVQFWRKGNYGWRDTGEGRLDPWGMSIIPMFNKSRLGDRYGRSDLKEYKSIIDAASRTLTNLQVAQEVSALPFRLIAGDGVQEALEHFPDQMAAYMGKLLGAPDGAKLQQVSGAPMDPFVTTYRMYALQISAMTGIPPSMMGISSDGNPTSADALRVAKDRLISRAETKQKAFSDSLESVARLIVEMNGLSSEGLETLEVSWQDAAAPSASAQMATALSAHSQGIISDETAREFIGLTPEMKKRENERSRDQDVMEGRGSFKETVGAFTDAVAARQVQNETTPESAK